jgi:transmembrane sensor
MKKRELYELSKKYLNGDANDTETKFIYDLVSQNIYSSLPEMATREIEDREKRMWSNIVLQLEKNKSVNLWWVYSAVASIIIISLVGISLFTKSGNNLPIGVQKSNTKNQMEITNTTNFDKEVNLEDGTTIVLKKNSKITYYSNFNILNREVYLTGEAFFKVKHDKKRPFYVYAQNLVTKVLGTSFNVKAYAEDKNVTVKVNSGKVTVFKKDKEKNLEPETKGLLLVPNQQVIFSKLEESLERTLVDKPVILDKQSEEFDYSYRNTSVIKILKQLEKAYGVELIYNEKAIINCSITTNLNQLPLFEKLDLIAIAIDAKYKVIDGKVIFEGFGCD